MSGGKIDIQWCPNHDDKYITFGTDSLSLFKVCSLREGGGVAKKEGVQISDESYASLLTANSEISFMKCVACCPQPEADHLVAVGLANGRIILTNLNKTGHIIREFVPRHPRQCNYLVWNPVDCNMLAEGLDKQRSDNSILIWDITRGGSDSLDRRGNIDTDKNGEPVYKLCQVDSTQSLAWFHHEPKTIVTGLNNRQLRIYDLRDVTLHRSHSITKAVYGVKVDPFSDFRLASYSENHVQVWDTRNFDKPIFTLPESKNIVKISWSPTRPGLIAALSKDSSVIKLYDIQNTTVDRIHQPDELDTSATERHIKPYSSDVVSSFDWHPTHKNRLLAITPSGYVKDVKIFERISLSWSRDIYLTWACGTDFLQCHSIKVSKEANEDISIKMKRRAKRGYGIQEEDISQNGLLTDDLRLVRLWNWLKYVQQLHEQDRAPTPQNATVRRIARIEGVKSTLKCDFMSSANGVLSDVDYLDWQILEPAKPKSKRIYRSAERLQALRLCGWGFDRDAPSTPFIDKLEKDGDFERAAAVAVFTVRMKRAVQVLNNGTKVSQSQGGNMNLNVVAMALSGFSENSLWRENCRVLGAQLKNPYTRTMFAFLTSETDQYETMLSESNMELSDRVAFACMYLTDAKLNEYIKQLTEEHKESGNLDGILLTGINTDGLDLLQTYIDQTGDVQTAACVIIQALPSPEIMNDYRKKIWFDAYRELLDTWKMWHERAEFDVYYNTFAHTRMEQQIFASCNYCGKSIAFNSIGTRNLSVLFGSIPSAKAKTTRCPSCKKPLPRCALCLINMGTAASHFKNKALPFREDHSIEQRKQAVFSDWFTWCQNCRHGGHSDHIAEWFREHSECPVTGCICKCTTLDAMGSICSNELEVDTPH